MRTCVAAAMFINLGCMQEPSIDASAVVVDENRDIANIARHFESLTQMTPAPAFVNPELAVLCVGAGKSAVQAKKTQTGPHTHSTVSIFMSEDAAKTFRLVETPYATGAVIVKQKHRLSYHLDDDFGKSVKPADGVGGMMKREPGYDPEHGNWEYFYFEDPNEIESGRIASCIECHRAAKNTDYVFGHWWSSAF